MVTIEKTFVTKEEKVESRWGGAPSCPQGLGLNGPIGPFKPSELKRLTDRAVDSTTKWSLAQLKLMSP